MILITGTNGRPGWTAARAFAWHGSRRSPATFARFARRHADILRGDTGHTVAPV